MSEAVEQAVRVRRAGATRRRLHRLDAVVSPYLYVGSFFVVFCVFGLFPLGYTAWMSLTDRNLLNPTTHFVGLDNYTALIHDSYFWNAVENTLGIWVLSTVPQLVLALVFAHFLNTRLRARTFFRMSVLLPQVTSVVAVALIFTQLFSRDYGLFNWMLGGIGISPVDWEAGRFSSWVAISTIGGLQLFTEPYLFEPIKQGALGGSARQYQTVAMYLYEKSFGTTQFKFGYAAAIAWSLFLIIVLISLVNFLLVRRIRSAEA